MIAIVGGGLIGLACGWELVRRGAEVVVYEGQAEQESASWAGAGMIAPFAEHFPSEEWRERAKESARLYTQFVSDLGGDIDYYPATDNADGHVDPRDLTRELRRHVRVEERVIEDLWEIDAEHVIVAAGAWAGHLRSETVPLPPTVPVKGYMLAWEQFAPGLFEGIRRVGHTYVFQRRRGSILAGSTEEEVGFDKSEDRSLLDDLAQRAAALVPELKDLPPTRHWLGFRPGTPDGMPVIQRWDDRVLLAYGHFRNGILLAPWTARWAAEQLGYAS